MTLSDPCLIILLPNPGTVHTLFMKLLLGLTKELQSRKISFALKTTRFSDIVMSRNYLLSVFLSDERFSHALFSDNDLSFLPNQFFRLLDFDAEFVAAVYPDHRAQDLVLQALYEADTTKADPHPIQNILSSAMKYLLTAQLSQTEQVDIKKDSFHTVATFAGRFSLIKQSVPQKMVEKGAADMLPRTALLPSNKDAQRFADFFRICELQTTKRS